MGVGSDVPSTSRIRRVVSRTSNFRHLNIHEDYIVSDDIVENLPEPKWIADIVLVGIGPLVDIQEEIIFENLLYEVFN